VKSHQVVQFVSAQRSRTARAQKPVRQFGKPRLPGRVMHGTAPKDGRNIHQGKLMIFKHIKNDAVGKRVALRLRRIEAQRFVGELVRMRQSFRFLRGGGPNEQEAQ
jgi:hypothetical protein